MDTKTAGSEAVSPLQECAVGRAERKQMTELSRLLNKVDPQLTIISPHHRHKKSNWEAAHGLICSQCKREVYRQRGGLCLRCWEEANEFEIRLGQGISAPVDPAVLKEILVVRKERG
jgi:hypothetical protein